MNKDSRLSKGFSMLEALTAMMVLSLLCLSLMTLQLQSMQAQRDALSLQQAVAMTTDLSQRMQVHPGAWPWYQLNLNQVPPNWDCYQQSCSKRRSHTEFRTRDRKYGLQKNFNMSIVHHQ
jgi:Tfp pilus assembly protein PilV